MIRLESNLPIQSKSLTCRKSIAPRLSRSVSAYPFPYIFTRFQLNFTYNFSLLMKTTVGKFFVTRLNSLQVDTVFTSSGPHTQPILREIIGDKSIRLVSTNNDTESVHAAIGYSKTKGIHQNGSQTLGVFVTSSQTVGNALSAFQMASDEHVPLVLIHCTPSGNDTLKMNHQLSQGVQNFETHGPLQNREHFTNFSVHSENVVSSQLASSQIDAVLTHAMTLSGPVYIEIPENIWMQETSEPNGKVGPKTLNSIPFEMERSMKHVIGAFKDSKNPLIWIGADVGRFNAKADTVRFINKIGVNFVTSLGSKSVIDEKNERFIGVYAGRSSAKYVIEAVRQSDVIFVIGETSTENSTFGISNFDLIGNNARRVIFINFNSIIEVNRYESNPVYIREFMLAMANSSEVNKFNQKNPTTVSSNEHGQSNNLTYDSIVSIVGQSPLVANANVIVDETLGVVSTANLTVKTDSFISSSGNGNHWGNSIATAIGATAANSNKRPIVFIGDGSLIASGQGIATLSKMKSDAIVVVFNNGIIGINQWSSNPRVYSNPKDPVDSFNTVQKWNPIKFAESFGAVGFNVETPSQFMDTLKRVEGADKVTVIDCKIPEKNIPINCQWRIPQ
jgi:thiamine pyrophosphate-dependent acetolactate synthase large subunit-like protein